MSLISNPIFLSAHLLLDGVDLVQKSVEEAPRNEKILRVALSVLIFGVSTLAVVRSFGKWNFLKLGWLTLSTGLLRAIAGTFENLAYRKHAVEATAGYVLPLFAKLFEAGHHSALKWRLLSDAQIQAYNVAHGLDGTFQLLPMWMNGRLVFAVQHKTPVTRGRIEANIFISNLFGNFFAITDLAVRLYSLGRSIIR